MSSRRFSVLFICCSICLFLLNAILNYCIDPYGIFETFFLKKEIGKNERYSKIQHLNENTSNSFMIGSSRIGLTNPKILKRYLDENFYNFTLGNANLFDTISLLKYLVRTKKHIQTLYIQIDLDYWNELTDYKNFNPSRFWHFNLNEKSRADYYSYYLFNFFGSAISKKIMLNSSGNKHFDIQEIIYHDDGRWEYTTRKIKKRMNSIKYIQNEKTLKYTSGYSKKVFTEINSNIETTIKNINRLCRENNIKCIFFTAPLYKNLYNTFSDIYIEKFLRLLLQNIDYPIHHFTYLNSITTDPFWYYEMHHYIEELSPLIAARIFNDKSVKVPEDFGVLLTKENIDEELEKIKKIEKQYFQE